MDTDVTDEFEQRVIEAVVALLRGVKPEELARVMEGTPDEAWYLDISDRMGRCADELEAIKAAFWEPRGPVR